MDSQKDIKCEPIFAHEQNSEICNFLGNKHTKNLPGDILFQLVSSSFF